MERRRLRVGLIGLGDIAAKAYLPVLAADAGVEPVLITRDPARRAALHEAWRVAEGYATIEEALASSPPLDAAFVHAATQAHPGIAVALIDAGIPTFVDKPLALSALEADAVIARAREAGVSFAVCFDHRSAQPYAEVGADHLDTSSPRPPAPMTASSSSTTGPHHRHLQFLGGAEPEQRAVRGASER